VPFSAIQKLTPSLQAPNGNVLTPVAKEPSVVRSAAFQSETLLPIWFVTRMRCPSNAAVEGAFSPLPVRVASTAPLVYFGRSRVGRRWLGGEHSRVPQRPSARAEPFPYCMKKETDLMRNAGRQAGAKAEP